MGLTFSDLAKLIGINKSAPSRWFSGEPPNWEANTIADIATALGVELEITARDRKTGQRFAPHGAIDSDQQPLATSTVRQEGPTIVGTLVEATSTSLDIELQPIFASQ